MDSPHNITPEEAEKKICPMRMVNNGNPFCDGPLCMAWRWKETAAWKEGSDFFITFSTTHGYCGMVRP